MIGADQKTLRRISYLEQKRQEIYDILITPRGSRAYFKDYGSDLYKLQDQPIFEKRRYVSAIGAALSRQVKDYELEKVSVTQPEPGHVKISILGVIPSLKTPLNLELSYG